MIIIFVLIVINRSQYTDVLRNKRYWNKQIFEGKYGKIPLPLCPQVTDGISAGMSNLQDTMRTGMTQAAQGLASASSVAARATNSMANSLATNTATNAAPA